MKLRVENKEKLGPPFLQMQQQPESVQKEKKKLKGQIDELSQQLVIAEEQWKHFRALYVQLKTALKNFGKRCEARGSS